ncbi:MAG: methylthioribulose 1-phosphate dehydratase [Myxococcales bacterium]|nr:methylthioribulose 1-phosphate dehydratase [Myxococcales bacterium]
MTDPLHALIDVGARFDRQGFVPATSGNFSVREGDGCWITASGRHKGRLLATDFVRVGADGELLERRSGDARPSAETSIHLAVYRAEPKAQVVLHIHELHGTLLSLKDAVARAPWRVELPSLEILKAFGSHPSDRKLAVDVFQNHHHVPDIARDVSRHYAGRSPEVPGFLIEGHGLTAWGESLERAEFAVEAFVFLFRAMRG